ANRRRYGLFIVGEVVEPCFSSSGSVSTIAIGRSPYTAPKSRFFPSRTTPFMIQPRSGVRKTTSRPPEPRRPSTVILAGGAEPLSAPTNITELPGVITNSRKSPTSSFASTTRPSYTRMPRSNGGGSPRSWYGTRIMQGRGHQTGQAGGEGQIRLWRQPTPRTGGPKLKDGAR